MIPFFPVLRFAVRFKTKTTTTDRGFALKVDGGSLDCFQQTNKKKGPDARIMEGGGPQKPVIYTP